MDAKEFVSGIRKSVVEENSRFYRDLFNRPRTNKGADPYIKRAFAFYDSLGVEQRLVLEEILQQVIVDTVSNVFGILDGSSYMEGATKDFHLTYNDDAEQLNGDLQSIFLSGEDK